MSETPKGAPKFSVENKLDAIGLGMFGAEQWQYWQRRAAHFCLICGGVSLDLARIGGVSICEDCTNVAVEMYASRPCTICGAPASDFVHGDHPEDQERADAEGVVLHAFTLAAAPPEEVDG